MHNPKSPSRFFSKTDLLLYLALCLAAFGRCLFLGQAYFDNDLLAQFGPWRAFLRDQLAQGHFPLWNPYNLGGQPFFADLQNMMLYPFNWPTLAFPLAYGMGVFFFIHMFWAALGMHLWLRLLGLSEGSSRGGAMLFALSNFYWLELIHPPVIAAFAWLPWLFAGLEALSHAPKPLPAFFSGLSFAMLFLCGSIQVTVGAFYGALAYFIYRVWVNRETWKPVSQGKPLVPYLLVGLLLIWGALPLLGQFIPTREFSSRCVRGASHQTYEQANAKLPLNPATLDQFLFPRVTVPPNKTMAEAIQFGNTDSDTHLAANLGYLGIWAPFLFLAAFQIRNRKMSWLFFFFVSAALLLWLGRYTFLFAKYSSIYRFFSSIDPGLSIIRVFYLCLLAGLTLTAFGVFFLAFQIRNRKIPWFFVFFILTALVLCFGSYTPLHRMLCAALPGLSIIQVPYRFLFLYVLAASALAAFGLETIISGAVKTLQKNAWVYAALFSLMALFLPGQTWREMLGLMFGVSAFFLWGLENLPKKIALFVFQAALAVPLLINGWGDFVPQPASNFDFAKNSKPFLQAVEKVKPFRVMFFNSEMGYPIKVSGRNYILNYPQNAACALGIKNFGGYNPLMLQVKKDIAPLSLSSLLQVGGIRGILRGKDQEMPGFKQEVLEHYRFFDFQGPLSYAYAPALWQTAPDLAQALALILKPGFDASKEAVLCEPLPAGKSPSLQASGPAGFQYQLELDEADSQRFSIQLDRDNLVVFPEINFPGWKATVDGRSTPLVTADYLLRAIFLDAGNHRVEFRFEPSWWRPITIGLAFWCFLTLLGLVWFKARRKEPTNA
jgi:hypothetical protein